MANTSINGSGRGEEARITRGITLYHEHGSEIADIGDDFFIVPSSEAGRSYVVDLGNEVCECRSYEYRGGTCKHLAAATIFRARSEARGPEEVPYRVCWRGLMRKEA